VHRTHGTIRYSICTFKKCLLYYCVMTIFVCYIYHRVFPRWCGFPATPDHPLPYCLDDHGTSIYRVSQKECARLQESVPYVKLYRYNPKHLCPKLNGYGDNGQRKVWASLGLTYCTPSVKSYLSNAPAKQLDMVMQ